MRRSLALLAVAGLVTALPSTAGRALTPASCDTSRWTSYDRPATYKVVTDADVPITMSDGVRLFADVYRPVASAGTRFPVVLTQSPYGKSLGAAQSFVERGYVQVVVQVRGTGTSEGTWHAFDAREQRDGFEVADWVSKQPWSDGRLALYGASYMAINQFFTAAQHPPGLKAMFPIVPEADAYRDIVLAGGQMNIEFIPAWLGLVTALGIAPGTTATSDPLTAVMVMIEHLVSVSNYQVPTVLGGLTGSDDIVYDGQYWQLRSPISIVSKVDVPAFITGGLHDLFQRGEPLLYEALHRKGVPTKLLMGPWGHLNGSSGAGLPVDNVPALPSIALRWFDQYVRGIDTGAACMPNVTQFAVGGGHFEVQPGWPHPDLAPQMQYLHAGGALSPDAPPADGGSDLLVQQPFSGVCSGSTNQWAMGALDGTPCANDNRLTEVTEQAYTTPTLTKDLRVDGPFDARIWVSTTAQEAVVVARVTDVAPDGTSTQLSAGLLAASHRALDGPRSRWVEGLDLQPWHPFSKSAVQAVVAGAPMALDIEIFPTNAVLKAGHALRISVGPSDFPHAASPLPAAIAEAGGVLTLYHDAAHPSAVTVPRLVSGHAASLTTPPVPQPAPVSSPAPVVQAARNSRLPATGGALPLGAGLASIGAAVGLRRRRRR